MKKSTLSATLGICAWLILTIIPLSLAQAPIARPVSTGLPYCSINEQHGEQINCSCSRKKDLSFSFKDGELTLQCD